MKKLFAILLAVSAIGYVISGCAKEEAAAPADGATKDGGAAPAATGGEAK